jgi:hypothetical protein
VIWAVRTVDRATGDQLEKLRGYADYHTADIPDPFFSSWDDYWTRAKTLATHVLKRVP